MKTIALLILALGIGISASFGARITPELREQMIVEGRAKFSQDATTAAHAAYCAARTESELADADGCGEHEISAPEVSEDLDNSAFVALWTAHVSQLRDAARAEESALLELRRAWLDALQAQVPFVAAARGLVPPDPGGRVTSWFSTAGMMFLFGLALIFVGAILGRKATKAEALSTGPTGDDSAGPRDFGEMLGELADEIGSLATQAKEIEHPTDDQFDSLKERIGELQVEVLEPLVESRARVQARYGMGPFAEIFGPLSASERKLNRSWAALVDRHWGESRASILGSHTEILRAQEALSRAVES